MDKYYILFVSVIYYVLCNAEADISEPCALEGGVPGACVKVSACASLVQLLKDGRSTAAGLLEVHKHICGYDEQEAKVCCPLEVGVEVNSTLESRAPVMDSSRAPVTDSDDFVDAFPEPPECGLETDGGPRSESCCAKIVYLLDGKPAYPGISRWMALLGYEGDAVFWKCGGTIITNKHVLTAAHCIKDNLYVVRVGEISQESKKKYEGNPADYLIKKTIRHEEYTKFHNDIGLVILQEQIQFNEYVSPICLPVAGRKYKKIQVGIDDRDDWDGLIEGWGITESGTKPSSLLYTYMNQKDNKVCQDLYQRYNVTIDDRVICAGAERGDACEGDSGSPFVGRYCTDAGLEDGKKLDWFYQLGIVSYGFKCSHSKFAAVYTRIQHFMPWLEQHVLGRQPHEVSKVEPSPEHVKDVCHNYLFIYLFR